MPCWPDVWNRIAGLRSLAEPAIVLIVIALLLLAPGVKWRWLRIVSRIAGALAALFVLVVAGFAVLLNSGNPRPQHRTLNSPTGLHQATLIYEGGLLGRDSTKVELTKKGCCEHFTAYRYDGPSELSGTTLLWLDDSHLQIQYRSDRNRYQLCETKVADVTIICAPLMTREKP